MAPLLVLGGVGLLAWIASSTWGNGASRPPGPPDAPPPPLGTTPAKAPPPIRIPAAPPLDAEEDAKLFRQLDSNLTEEDKATARHLVKDAAKLTWPVYTEQAYKWQKQGKMKTAGAFFELAGKIRKYNGLSDITSVPVTEAQMETWRGEVGKYGPGVPIVVK